MDENLEDFRKEFAERPFLATPISGMIMWTLVGISGMLFSDQISVWVLFVGVGSIVYLSLFVSKFTGEDFLDKSKPNNPFDTLFFYTVGQAVLIYAIAIPFFLQDYTSLPLTVGVLTGSMWIPFSWIIKHWVGLFHSLTRTVLVVAVWYLFPELRFILVPFVIVGVYIATIIILKNRRSYSIMLK